MAASAEEASAQKKRPPSISDVARAANVSSATVSRVLNGVTNVSPALRDRVLEAVDAVDYRRNRLARNLRVQRTDMVGVVVPDIENPHFAEAVRVIEDQAFQVGFRVLLCNTDETVAKQESYLAMLSDERVVAAVVAPADEDGTGIDLLTGLGIPVVAFDRALPHKGVDAVFSDGAVGVRRLTEHFVSLGHKRILYVGGRQDVITGATRLAGYTEAMSASGLSTAIGHADFRLDTAEALMSELLGHRPWPTAMVVGNNLMSIGVLKAMRRAGVLVPDDIALGSVDDPPWAELLDPSLTTLAQPVRSMAETAMEMVLERLSGSRAQVRHESFEMELRIRNSSGPPPPMQESK